MKPTTTYIPGVCNINHSEIKKRQTIGVVGLVALVILAVVLVLLHAPLPLRLTVFFPAFLMATGFLQAKNKFCVGYASAGMYHTDDEAAKVEMKESIALDKARARKMNFQVLFIALAITALFFVIPA
ncbi:MAG: hypothetical protein ABIQ04_03460 [Candidatus Saccharimonadales bacterium]